MSPHNALPRHFITIPVKLSGHQVKLRAHTQALPLRSFSLGTPSLPVATQDCLSAPVETSV